MAHYVYLLKGASGRHYIGATSDVARRLAEHQSGKTHTTRRLGGGIELIASKGFETKADALLWERRLKSWKNPAKVREFLSKN